MTPRVRAWVVASAVGAVAALAISARPHSPTFVWNASASVPEGLYQVRPARKLQVGDVVVVAPPEPLASFLAQRRYLPRGALLLKPVAALPGHTICRAGLRLQIDAAPRGDARATDNLGRRLPAWRGCRRIRPGEVFLMNPTVSDSFDGRYFGALPVSAVIGRATPIWLSLSVRRRGPIAAARPSSASPSPNGDPRP
ncbi:S26 family signal peptidase [Phenylobacterium sp.]|uniref:S26 family signal peptidase n=1 Tax=Phenylobacterium sp. TaxID=1871053 RepID=UPI0035B2FF11